MEYEDRRTISTPEGVDLEIPLAGLGSRGIGFLLDSLIQFAVIAIAIVAALAAGTTVAAAVIGSSALLLVVAYDVVFEVRGGGRTPGKRAAGTRVVMDGGVPIGLRASLIRNITRLFEGFALSYIPAIISILVTRNNQRLGDLAAGTIVIRDRRPEAPEPYIPRASRDTGALDVTGVTEAEIAIVRSFLARRHGLELHARRTLAAELAGKMRQRVAGARAGQTDEEFLEYLATAKAKR
jgi:uncharacterized RDD family membrane protein YckC